MFRRRQTEAETSSHEGLVPGERGVAFAWKTHNAITDWTAKVDYKAAIVLSLGGILLGFFVTLSAQGRLLAGLRTGHVIVERIGLGFTILGVLLAGLVVAPRLNRRASKSGWRENFIYFGHLRRWEPVDLKDRLLSIDANQELNILATQLVNTSRIAWRKHSLLQYSMICLAIGVGLVALAVV
jgi:hypothetical protein